MDLFRRSFNLFYGYPKGVKFINTFLDIKQTSSKNEHMNSILETLATNRASPLGPYF